MLTPGKILNQPFIRLLDSVGDGSGGVNAIGDYSAAPVEFSIRPPDGQVLVLTQLTVHYNAPGIFGALGYANLPALPVGILLDTRDRQGSVVSPLTGQVPVTFNTSWMAYGYNMNNQSWGGAETTIEAVLNMGAFDTGFEIDGNKAEYLAATLNDDFTGIVVQTFLAKGYIK